MMIKTKIDTGATSEEQGFYDYMLIMIQFMSPAMMVYVGLMKCREVILKRLRKKRKSKLQAASAPSDVERGVELTGVGGVGVGMVLGGGEVGERPNNPMLLDLKKLKNGKATGVVENSKPLSSYDLFNKRGGAGKGRAGKGKKNGGMAPPTRPSMIPPPLSALKMSVAPGPPPGLGAPCEWTEEWDSEVRALYYLKSDGSSTWDMPKDFWRAAKAGQIERISFDNATLGLSKAPTQESELPPPSPRNNQPPAPSLLDFTKGVSEITPPPPARPSTIPPPKIPPPTVRTSMIPPPQTQPPTLSTGWKKNWSDEHNEFYYLNKDGESQWERPKGYVEK
jgi:hypothetical protein